ncbi:MAG: hypothetical protein KAH54_11735, partial [Candidatus Sabulitectum sp.]|nr:hypothetical protein [Candidatus Sabulitectum sp.]
GIPVNMPEGVSYSGIFGGTGAAQPAVSSSMFRTASAAPSGYGGGGGAQHLNGAVARTEAEECCDMANEYIPVYSATLGGVSDYLGARPSEFRSVILELITELNANGDILSPGEIEFEVTVNSAGVITRIRIIEDSVGVDVVTDVIENFLIGETIQGASAGTSTVTIAV